MNEGEEIKMPVLNINTAEIRRSGRELGFIVAEFIDGFMEGIEEYHTALEAARKKDAPGEADAESEE